MKEYRWNVVLGGRMHTILCIMDNNGYDVYDGDNRIARVHRKSVFHNLRGGVERDLNIDGHTVRFVALDRYSPDIVVDGIKIGENVPYDEAKKNYKNAMFMVYVVCVAFCFAMFGGAVVRLFVPGKTIADLLGSVLCLAGGVFCIGQLFKFR